MGDTGKLRLIKSPPKILTSRSTAPTCLSGRSSPLVKASQRVGTASNVSGTVPSEDPSILVGIEFRQWSTDANPLSGYAVPPQRGMGTAPKASPAPGRNCTLSAYLSPPIRGIPDTPSSPSFNLFGGITHRSLLLGTSPSRERETERNGET